MRLPPAVGPGDLVGVAALSGPVDGERLDAGLHTLETLGFRVEEAANLRRRHGLFAGDDSSRLAAFHRLAARPEVKAIFFARGGWGVNRLLPAFDWQLLARCPRAYVGYSDLTPFLLQVVERLGIVAFHGPMVAADLARGLRPREEESLLDALAGRLPRRLPLAWVEPVPDEDRTGSAIEAPLLGGCASLWVSLLGTPWQPRSRGCLLFLEDLNEVPYRFDRMLTHLRLSGTLAEIRGLILGHLHAEGGREPTAQGGEVTLGGLARELAEGFPWPLATGLEAGHASPNLTLPLGMAARLEPASSELVVGLCEGAAARTPRPEIT
ncbi:MAG: LD-carboxypeptidase [Holophagales bacterium]|nr:LD-carboxypeptidase [Holophagales bacterium]